MPKDVKMGGLPNSERRKHRSRIRSDRGSGRQGVAGGIITIGGSGRQGAARGIITMWIAFVLAGPGIPAFCEAIPAAPSRVAFLVPLSSHASSSDALFLAAVPAAAAAGNGEPIVCAVRPEAPWRPELLDYLHRYEPDRVVWLGPAPAGETAPGLVLEVIAADTALDAACKLATSFWRRSSRAVACDAGDRASALAAAVLAARMRVPLFPWSSGALPEDMQTCLAGLGVSKLVVVGAPAVEPPDEVRVEHLEGALEVARRLAEERLEVDYLAVVHPRDGGTADAPRLSLAAVLLAAGRGGAIVPLPFDTIWKRRFVAGEPVEAAPEGAQPSGAGHRTGTVDIGATARTFVTGQDTADGRWWVQLDLDGDGRFDGAAERPVRTGGVVAIGGTRYVVDLDVLEKARGSALWLTTPTPGDIVECLDRYREAIDAEPRYLCLVGWPDAVPLAIAGDGQGIDGDVVTDHPYAQTDDDPFVDVAFARFLAEDVTAGTLLACRSLTFDDLRDRKWAGTYATAEWAGREGNPLELAGLRHAGHHEGASPIDADSPLTRVGAIFHGSHAMWTELGKTYTWNSDVLLSPCIVESSGCATAAIDQDPERRSVAARMLRNGAVAFFGSSRRCVAQGNLYRSELWNALLNGHTLGEAHRTALNRSMVAILEKGELERGLYRYQHDHVAAYGDPALAFGLQKPRAAATAHVEVRGLRAVVVAPRDLTRLEYAPSSEWGCRFPKLWTWTGLGLGTESRWHDGEKRNEDDLLITAEVRSRRPIVGVEPLQDVPAPLGWTGSCFVDKHADGTRSLYWRCRMIDFDMTTGKVRKQIRRITFRLRTE